MPGPGIIGRVLVRLLALSFVTACVGAGMQPPKAPRASYSVIRAFPHDRAAFTQGFEYFDGVFYEGTGLSGKSSIRKVNVETGEVLQRRDVAAEYFGEGITIWRNDLIELTWQSKVAFVYDRATFAPKRTFSYPGEGWGLTHDETTLIMSDGSAALRFLDPVSFAERRRVTVTDGGVPVPRLNELEYVKGQVYANVWQTYLIARIAPDSGRVVGWIDLTGLLTTADSAGADVMNGIAYDAAHDRLFVTGKLWPKVFEIKVR